MSLTQTTPNNLNNLCEENELNGASPEVEAVFLPETNESVVVKAKPCSNYTGIILTLIASLAQTLGGVIVKYLQGEGYHPFNLAIFRFLGLLLPSLVSTFYTVHIQKVTIFKGVKHIFLIFIILRCTFGTFAPFLRFYALRHLTVADDAVIGACQPIFVGIVAFLFLHEAFGYFQLVIAILALLGVGIISRPPVITGNEAFDQDALIGTLFSLGNVTSVTIVLIILRYLKEVHITLLTLTLGIWGTISSVICACAVGELKLPTSWLHLALAFGLGGTTLIGKVCMAMALKYEQAGAVSLIRRSDCFYAFILQYLLLNTVPDVFSVIGASIIIFCMMMVTFRKWISSLPEKHSMKERFSLLLK